ncbi:MAG: hypothetical protein ACI8P2_002356, partial [Candidatus Latescibacterota bacterium]
KDADEISGHDIGVDMPHKILVSVKEGAQVAAEDFLSVRWI